MGTKTTEITNTSACIVVSQMIKSTYLGCFCHTQNKMLHKSVFFLKLELPTLTLGIQRTGTCNF